MSFNAVFYTDEPMEATFQTDAELQAEFTSAIELPSADYYEGSYTVTPAAEEQTIPVRGKTMEQDLTVEQIPTDYAGSAIPRLGATEYTPSKAAPIIIPAGKLLTGDQTLKKIPDEYYDMSGAWAWLGKDAELVAQDFYEAVDTLDNTLFNGWTPSTTAKAIVASSTLSSNKFEATSIDEWAYYIFWECGVDIEYTGSPTLKALPTLARALIVQCLGKRPSSWANIGAGVCNGTFNQAAFTSSLLRYYGTTTGSITYTWAASNGLYFGATSPTISDTAAVSPNITPKTPTLNAKMSTTYMSTASANAIDQENTKWWIKGSRIMRARRDVYTDGYYRYMCQVINDTPPELPTT